MRSGYIWERGGTPGDGVFFARSSDAIMAVGEWLRLGCRTIVVSVVRPDMMVLRMRGMVSSALHLDLGCKRIHENLGDVPSVRFFV